MMTTRPVTACAARWTQYRVLEAESVAAARQIMARETPHLLLLDIEIPEENGLDYLRELKAQPSSPAVIMAPNRPSETSGASSARFLLRARDAR